MAHTYEELKHMTLAELREVAAGIDHEAVQGYTQMNKEHLLPAVCQALGVEMHAHHEVVGVDKSAIKQRIHALKRQRDEALKVRDHGRLKSVRREIHDLKREIRKATV